MSYCIAWKHENNVFMLSDTAVSSKNIEPLTNYNSMGELQTTHYGYIVEEGILKLIKISDNFAVSYATNNIDTALEMISNIKMLSDNLSDNYKFDDLLSSFKATYGTNTDTELLFVYSYGQDKIKIYKFSGGDFRETDYAYIGSGKNTKSLLIDVQTMINDMYKAGLNNMEPNYYLALVASTLQCYLYHNQYFKHGIGGVITGLFLNYKIHFCRDLEFYFFEDNINYGDSLSVINRYNSFCSSSNVGQQRIYLNPSDSDIFEDDYILSSISKSLNGKSPYYYIFYCNRKNVMVFIETNGQLHNIHFSRFIRRDLDKTDYAFFFSPTLLKIFDENDDSAYTLPAVFELGTTSHWNYKTYTEMLNALDFVSNVDVLEVDFDFEAFIIPDFNKKKLQKIKKEISKFHNIVVIDYEYLYLKIKEKYELYHPYYYFSLEELDLTVIARVFRELIPEDDFYKYCIVVVKTKDEKKIIDNYDLNDFINKYSNVFCIYNNVFEDVLFELLKQYYINDSFFHIDKFVIITDNSATANLLDTILPKYNYKQRHPDVFLVRNMNFETSMPSGLRYVVSDIFVSAAMKLSLENMGLLEAIAYKEIDINPEDISMLPFNT